MKHFLIAVALAVVAIIAAATAQAQAFEVVKFHLDNQTRVGSVVLPAGDYEIRGRILAGAESVFEVSSDKVQVLVQANYEPSSSRFDHTELVLARTAELPRVTSLRIGGTGSEYRFLPN